MIAFTTNGPTTLNVILWRGVWLSFRLPSCWVRYGLWCTVSFTVFKNDALIQLCVTWIKKKEQSVCVGGGGGGGGMEESMKMSLFLHTTKFHYLYNMIKKTYWATDQTKTNGTWLNVKIYPSWYPRPPKTPFSCYKWCCTYESFYGQWAIR